MTVHLHVFRPRQSTHKVIASFPVSFTSVVRYTRSRNCITYTCDLTNVCSKAQNGLFLENLQHFPGLLEPPWRVVP